MTLIAGGSQGFFRVGSTWTFSGSRTIQTSPTSYKFPAFPLPHPFAVKSKMKRTIGFVPSRTNPANLKVAVWEGVRPQSITETDKFYFGRYNSRKHHAVIDVAGIAEIIKGGVEMTDSFRDFWRVVPKGSASVSDLRNKRFAIFTTLNYRKRKRRRSAICRRPKSVRPDFEWEEDKGNSQGHEN